MTLSRVRLSVIESQLARRGVVQNVGIGEIAAARTHDRIDHTLLQDPPIGPALGDEDRRVLEFDVAVRIRGQREVLGIAEARPGGPDVVGMDHLVRPVVGRRLDRPHDADGNILDRFTQGSERGGLEAVGADRRTVGTRLRAEHPSRAHLSVGVADRIRRKEPAVAFRAPVDPHARNGRTLLVHHLGDDRRRKRPARRRRLIGAIPRVDRHRRGWRGRIAAAPDERCGQQQCGSHQRVIVAAVSMHGHCA